jgi:hypothetical protein
MQLVHRRNQRQPAGHVVIAQSARRLFQIGLKMIRRQPVFPMPLARYLRQSLQQRLRFPHHHLGNQLVMEFPEKVAVAGKIAAVEKRNGEFRVIRVVAIALGQTP